MSKQFSSWNNGVNFLANWDFKMSSLGNGPAASTETRLPVVTGVTVDLIAQLSELNELREQVRKAELSAPKPRRTNHQKRTHI
jgi:hypothetical protein